jgi:hypothetical protein
VVIRARAESEDGSVLGDMRIPVFPGESFEGFSYDQLRQMAADPGYFDLGDE